TPHLAILITAVADLALTISGTFTYVITLNVISRLLVFICTAVALVVFRRRSGSPPAMFVLPGGTMVAAIVCAASLWLLASSGARELRDVAIALAAGSLVFLM